MPSGSKCFKLNNKTAGDIAYAEQGGNLPDKVPFEHILEDEEGSHGGGAQGRAWHKKCTPRFMREEGSEG